MQAKTKAHSFAVACAFAAFAIYALAATTLVAATPTQAFAKNYSMPQVDIAAQLDENDTMHVEELRTFDFDGNFTCVWWTFDNFIGAGRQTIDSVGLKVGGGPMEDLFAVPFETKWRDSGGPGITCYSLDEVRGGVYVFFDVTDENVQIKLDYHVENMAQAYDDVAEIYWKYVGSQWAEPSSNITCTVSLPIPEGVVAQLGENVRAWGHGDLGGTVSFGEDRSVVFFSPNIASGEFAEARIAFPVEWLTAAPAEATYSGNRLDTILTEEQQWADEANRSRMIGLAVLLASALLCIAAIAWALVMFFRHGKEYKAEFTDEYWRDIPDPDASPASIAKLWHKDTDTPDELTATILDLAQRGALRLEPGQYADERGRMVGDYCIIRVPEVADQITRDGDPVAYAAMEALFDKFANGKSAVEVKGQDHIWLETMKLYGKEKPTKLLADMTEFYGVVAKESATLDYYEPKGGILGKAMATLGVVFAAAGIAASVFAENFIWLAEGLATGVILFAISCFMDKKTHRGAEVFAKCKALENWLVNFTAIDERPPTDVKVWGVFMVYAFIFGVADKVLKELRMTVPQVFDDAFYAGGGYVPWYVWYGAGNANQSMSNAFSLSNAISNTVNTAKGIVNSSSGSGGGGGFSGGGGFGGGGGGGGAR